MKISNIKKNIFLKVVSAIALAVIFTISSCGSDDPVVDPCASGTLAVTATTDVYDITAAAVGGTAPYTYSINGTTFQSAATFTDNAVATYTITVKDANECTATFTVDLADPCSTLAVTATTDVYNITAVGTGGTTPYEYAIDGTTFQSAATFADNAVATYTITIKDANECTATVTVDLADPCSTLVVMATADAYDITATAEGGAEPYEYAIDGTNFQSSGSFVGNAIGTYTITVKDANACTATSSVVVEDPCTTLVVTATSEAYDITAVADGGAEPYEYSIDDGVNFQSAAIFADNAPGTYTITVKDANACTATDMVTVKDCSTLVLTTYGSLGDITATATGGTAPYEYAIDGATFQAASSFIGLATADYTVTVRDANGCETTAMVASDDLLTMYDVRDGNRYDVVTIGTQTWMAENLNYQSGTSVCYDDDTANCDTYGALYTWTDAKTVAPAGWHLPSKAEWDALITELGGFTGTGAKLKVGGSSGFEALLAGINNNTYTGINEFSYFWTQEEVSATEAIIYGVNLSDHALYSPFQKAYYVSVRCIRD